MLPNSWTTWETAVSTLVSSRTLTLWYLTGMPVEVERACANAWPSSGWMSKMATALTPDSQRAWVMFKPKPRAPLLEFEFSIDPARRTERTQRHTPSQWRPCRSMRIAEMLAKDRRSPSMIGAESFSLIPRRKEIGRYRAWCSGGIHPRFVINKRFVQIEAILTFKLLEVARLCSVATPCWWTRLLGFSSHSTKGATPLEGG